jgi:prepilin-type N-terminal cleavage/methylation domain-containing protein
MRRRNGFSLIEILVVLVVLLVGILSVIRIFPLGLVALGNTRDYTMAQQLARRELDMLAAHAGDLPQQILPVRYTYVNNGSWQLVIQSSPDTNPDDLGPGGPLHEDGNIIIDNPGGGVDTTIPWRFYNDANRVRRIIGEGGTIPAPRPVGTEFGGLRILSFGPVVDDPSLLLVYGQEMEEEGTQGSSSGDPRRNPRAWQFVHDDDAAQVWLPGTANRDVSYKMNFSYWTNNGGQYRKVDVIDVVVTVSPSAGSIDPRRRQFDVPNNQVYPFDLKQISGAGSWAGLVPDSVSVNRLFDRLAPADLFDVSYPYQFKVLNGSLGSILFNPLAYNYRERRGRERVPLTAQVNYDVFNWHIIADEFRADRGRSPIEKLSLQRLKSIGEVQNDKRRYSGLGFPVPAGSGNFDLLRDVVVLDMDTGGIVSPQVDPDNPGAGLSYKVDYLRGVIALGSPRLPPPGGPKELGRSITIIMQDANQSLMTNVDPAGRNFRVFYEANNDWAVQVLKAPQRIDVTYSLPLGIAQSYVGNSTPGLGDPTRLYFPMSDNNSKVTIREIWYRDNGGVLRVLRDHDFLVRLRSLDSIGSPLPSVDIREADPNAVSFDFATYGYAVRGVAGSSIRSRVIWNTMEKGDVRGDGVTQVQDRMDLHQAWTNNWRKVEVESFMTRRDEQ